MNNKVIVIIGITHHNTLSVVRSFGRVGTLVDVILYDGFADSFVFKSRYVQNAHVVSDIPSVLECLNHYYESAVVVACSDGISSLMDIHYDNLKNRYHFFHCNAQGKLTDLMNKKVQVHMAADAGFMVPATQLNQEVKLDSWQQYPCIVKPLTSAVGGKSLTICKNKESLCSTLVQHSEPDSMLVQQMINIKNEIVILGLSVGGEVYVSGVIHKHRELIGGTTFSTVKDIDSIPSSLVTACEILVKSSSYEGLFGIECAYDGTSYQFIEINYRNDATTYALCVAGRNLLAAYYQYIIGNEDWKSLINSDIHEIDSMVELRDIIHVMKRRVGLFKWLQEFKNSKCRYFRVKDDMKPYYAERNKMIKNFVHKII